MHVDPHATPERLLHTMLRVGDLQRSIDFYTRVLGMRLLRREDHEDGRYTLAFVGYDDEDAASVLELTHNWDVDRYEIGTAYGHVALAVRDVALATARAAQHGATVLRAAGPRSGHPTERIAFIADPDGYRIEFIERPDRVSA